jgi:hypothetical protein
MNNFRRKCFYNYCLVFVSMFWKFCGVYILFAHHLKTTSESIRCGLFLIIMGALGFYHFFIQALIFNRLAFIQEREEFERQCKKMRHQMMKMDIKEYNDNKQNKE